MQKKKDFAVQQKTISLKKFPSRNKNPSNLHYFFTLKTSQKEKRASSETAFLSP